MAKSKKSKNSNLSFMGWRRENGRVGVRNHVILLPLDDLSNAACEAVANNIKGTIALPHHYGRLQFGADLELHFRTIIGTGANPNVAAVVVIDEPSGELYYGSDVAAPVFAEVMSESLRLLAVPPDAMPARDPGSIMQAMSQ